MTKGRPVPPQPTTPREEAIGQASEYIFSNWPNLASLAYAAHLQKGRGILYIDFTGRLTEDKNLVGMTYFNTADVLKHWGMWPDESARHFVETYDPDNEAVLLLHLKDGGEVCHTFRGEMTPRAAYEEAKKAHRTTLSA
jgi:hypothetical protein